MPFQRPGLTDLISRIQADLRSRMPNQKGALLRRSVLAVVARAVGGGFHLQHGHLDWISKQTLPDTAEDENIARHAGIWGLNRKPAEFAGGDIEVTGNDGNTVPAGTRLARGDGVEYETDADASISGGSATVSVSALEAGAEGNADSGVVLSFVSPVPGVDSNATVASGGIVGGTDEETDDQLRQRLLAIIQAPPHGGADFDYIAWAKEVAGVTRAWAYENHTGAGTVGVTFVKDNSDPIIPTSQDVSDVQDYIDERRPVTAKPNVFAPVEVPLDPTIKISPNTQEVRDNVTAQLEDMFKREAEPGGIILYSHLRESVSNAFGEEDHQFVDPTSDVVHAADEMPTVGTITFQDL